MKVKKSTKTAQLYSVEKVLDKKKKSGKTFYLIKWQNYSNEFNSWEPRKNLMVCPELIAEYEEEHAEEAHGTGKNRQNKRNNIQEENTNEIKGIPKEVIGIVEDKSSPQNDFNFLIGYENGQASIVARKVAHESELCQQIVIQFYEDNLVWTENEKKKMNEMSEE